LVPGQTFSGDQYVVCEIPEGALIGVCHGLGHGEEAAAAALTATAFLKQNAIPTCFADPSLPRPVKNPHGARS